jgi:diguanylate cyclase (GGDEF)-like protein
LCAGSLPLTEPCATFTPLQLIEIGDFRVADLGPSTDQETLSAPAPDLHALSSFERFPELEAQFRASYLDVNIGRATVSTAIYLALLAIVTAFDMMGSGTQLSTEAQAWVLALRLGVACPALVVILCAIEFRPLRAHYQTIVGAAAVVLGISVMAVSAIAENAGFSQVQMGDVLVIVYACLFVGLLFHVVVIVAAIHVIAFASIGEVSGLPLGDVTFGSAVVIATALMAVLSARRLERLSRTNFLENRALNEIAERDGLTGLYNRRKFDELAEMLWAQARRDMQRLQILVVDIDCFKSYNDLYGHQAGDDCIRRVARIIDRAARRPLDFAARYGGEEFVLVLFGPSSREPAAVAEQIRVAVMEENIPHKGSSVASVLTVSVGSSSVRPNAWRSLAGLIQQADEALYAAKQGGRNLVIHEDVDEFGRTGAFEVPTAV